MLEYQLYCLDEAGKFTKAHEIEAADDADALERAKKMKLPVNCELWEHKRIVGKVPAHG